jgi:HEAT repeat protein
MEPSLPNCRLAFLAPLIAVGALAACSPAEPLPPLPGVAPGQDDWFWRDVLAAALPAEPAAALEALAAQAPGEREAALAELVTSGDPRAQSTLLHALRDPSEGVAINAARDLGRGGAPSAWPRLIKGLGPYPVDYDAPIAVRVAQAAALARGGHPGGMDLLMAVLAEDTDRQLGRDQLAWEETDRMVFLRELALDGVLPLLGSDLSYEPNASVPARQASYDALAARWEARRTALWNGLDLAEDPGLATRIRLMIAHLDAYQLRQIDGARFTLTHLGPAVLPFLQEGLESESTYTRVHVLEVMERLADRHDDKTALRLSVVAAIPLVDDPSPVVAAQAARVCGAARVADPLVAALDRRSEPEVVLAVVDALGRTGLEVAAERLAEYQPRAPVPKDLTAALVAARLATDPDADPAPLIELLGSGDPDVAYPAIERLVQLTGSDHGLTPGLTGDDRTAALAAAAVALAAR